MPQGVEHKTGLPGPCSRWWLGVTLSLLAVALLAPASARAGCGDHVVAMHLSAPMADAPTPSPAPPFKKDVPCSGPNCSRSPVAPTPAPVESTVPDAQEWACMLEPATMPLVTSTPYNSEDHRERPFAASSSIYHPPR